MISKIIDEMIRYFGTDVRRINHALKVHGFAKAICGNEKLSDNDKKVIEFAAILHDIGIKQAELKYNSHAGNYQELEGPPVAREILNKYGVEEDITNRVCFIIGNHHTYSKIDGIDFQILVEADFLVNIFEDEMDEKAIRSIRNKYIKTTTCLGIFDAIYPKSKN